MDEILKNWKFKAESDLKAAKQLFDLDEPVTDVICYHCQQVVEKYLKMYLISQKQQINKTHNLKYLLKLCVRIDKDFDKLDVGDLTDYAIELRYPDNFYIPDLEETKEALEIAETIKSFVLNKLTL